MRQTGDGREVRKAKGGRERKEKERGKGEGTAPKTSEQGRQKPSDGPAGTEWVWWNNKLFEVK